MKIFTLLIILTIGFVLNILIYSASESYRSFLKSFKNEEDIQIVDDDYIIDAQEIKNSLESDLKKKVNLLESDQQKVAEIVKITPEVQEKKKLKLSEYEKEVLFLFNDYNFTKLNSHSALFDLTEEYPDEYFEYYSPDLTLIMFSTKSYQEVKIILQTIGGLENFRINEVDNFGDESFYINIDETFDDGLIRIVFKKNGKVFGLKISKNEYTNVKKILQTL